jgi:XRE family aerobic/anaerobic benzoate catabolism transcriptional regulator
MFNACGRLQPAALYLFQPMDNYFDQRTEFLARLGRRVRTFRLASQLTVAEFAQRATLSPRFINQLEAGRGNISVVNLATVARALDRTFYELIPPNAGDRSLRAQVWSVLSNFSDDELRGLQQWLGQRRGSVPAARFIALLGIRLAGKSTVGRLLARRLKTDFVELDRNIEAAAGMPVGEIFATHGESYYRRLEREALDKLFATSPGCVFEPGGSVVTSGESWELIKRRCFTVWLDTPPAELIRRLKGAHDMKPSNNRNLWLAGLKALLRRRTPLYAESRFAVRTNRKPGEVVAEIVKALAEEAAAAG